MFCRECGNKLLDGDKFCASCGTKVLKNINIIEKENKNLENIETKKDTCPSMLWYNFFTYFRLPAGIIASISSLFLYNYNSFIYDKIELGIFLLNWALIILLSSLLYMMHKKTKNTMKFIIAELVVECLSIIGNLISSNSNPLILTMTMIIVFIIWFVPNYIYFNKRKDIFIN